MPKRILMAVLFPREQEKRKRVKLVSSLTCSFPEVRWPDPSRIRRVNYTLVPNLRNYSIYQGLYSHNSGIYE
jgi:hypothetical protein